MTRDHNPDSLTAEQVGVGYRLLTEAEVAANLLRRNRHGNVGIEAWNHGLWSKRRLNGQFYVGDFSAYTYRVKRVLAQNTKFEPALVLPGERVLAQNTKFEPALVLPGEEI